MKIFLIAGKAQSGKGSVAKIIKQYYDEKGQKSIITEYSKYVKLYAREMTSWNGENTEKPRKFLQEMGSYIRNKLNMPDLFITRMKEDIKIYQNFFDNIIIADVRYPEELEKIKAVFPNVYTFYIINDHGTYDLSIEEANHESEHALEEYNAFDYFIINEKKEELEDNIKKILEEIT